MATKAPQVPGAPAEHVDHTPEVDPRDAEIARLRAALASSQPSEAAIIEGGSQRTALYKAESKHLHLKSAELAAMVASGEVKLTEHHVLCRDGWFVNPAAQAQANG